MFITPSFKKSLIAEQFQGNYLKEAWKGFSLHAHAQSTPRCTRQLYESK